MLVRPGSEILDHRTENIQEGAAIFVILIDRLATITAGSDVVKRTGKLESQGSGHRAIIAVVML